MQEFKYLEMFQSNTADITKFVIIFQCHNSKINVRLRMFSDGSFGLLKDLYSTVDIYNFVQKIIEMHFAD